MSVTVLVLFAAEAGIVAPFHSEIIPFFHIFIITETVSQIAPDRVNQEVRWIGY